MDLPALSDSEVLLLQEMRTHLGAAIRDAGGALPFDRFMELALYAPQLGYYVNGRRRFGGGGDFVTAPELSPLFGRCLARQVAECMDRLETATVLELGAGSGRMAATMLGELERLGRLPTSYLILELSPDLVQTQRETLTAAVPALLPRVTWLDRLPPAGFCGVLVANELLDAMPVHRFRRVQGTWQELFVAGDAERLHDHWAAPRSLHLVEALDAIWPDATGVAEGYSSELNLRLAPWLGALAERIQRGFLLLIDYGYTRHEYYHPQRATGTLICHFRHRAYSDPYRLPGLQDMTANVDFSALASAATTAGFVLAGFTTQAHFLIDNGLEKLLARSDPSDVQRYLELTQGVKKLTLPSEMGERFKVMALARDANDAMLSGFRSRDLRGRL